MNQSNCNVHPVPGGVPIKAWTRGVPVEDTAMGQLINAAHMPFIHKWVAAMPDVHYGIGATVGSVIPTVGAIIPAAVGVDIGCGMAAVRTALKASDLPDDLGPMRSQIEAAIPHGRSVGKGKRDPGSWGEPPIAVGASWVRLQGDFKRICSKYPKLQNANTLAHLGTLGTGNHFVEVCLDEEQRVWVMLHSGSRGVGNAIGSFFIARAKEEIRRWFINIPDIDLAYLPEGSELFEDYVFAVEWAQRFAAENRRLMMNAALLAIGSIVAWIPTLESDTEHAINCHHNYVSREHHFGKDVWLTRKGAVRARTGDLGIIPGSMGAKSFIVRGKGNPESFHSCSHGAGRKMSRTEAKRRFTIADHEAATAGVECRKDEDVIDETPMAYKDIDAVMEAQSDLVEIIHTLKQVLCVKG